MATSKKTPGHGSKLVENSKLDKMKDKKNNIKEGSPKDKAMDKQIGNKLLNMACGGRAKKKGK